MTPADRPLDPNSGVARERERLAKLRAGSGLTGVQLEAARLARERERLKAIAEGEGPERERIRKRAWDAANRGKGAYA